MLFRSIARHDWASVRVAQARGACVRMALHAKVVTGRDSGDLWRCCLGPVLVYAHGLPSVRGPPSRVARNSGAQARPAGVRARGDHHFGGFTSDAELQRHQRDKRRLCNVLEPMVHRTRHTRCTPSARSQHCPPPALPRLHQGVCTSRCTAPHRTRTAQCSVKYRQARVWPGCGSAKGMRGNGEAKRLSVRARARALCVWRGARMMRQ